MNVFPFLFGANVGFALCEGIAFLLTGDPVALCVAAFNAGAAVVAWGHV